MGEHGGSAVNGRGSIGPFRGRAQLSTTTSTGRAQGFPQLSHRLVIAMRDRVAVDVCFRVEVLGWKICRFVRGLHDAWV